MKTAEEKVQEFLKAHVQTFTSKQERALILLLKEQDRDTRHACAEAVIGCESITWKLVNSDCAHDACMNVKAV